MFDLHHAVQGVVERLADDRAVDAGVIAQAGTPEDLYERPATEFVAGFMGEAMLFAGEVLEGGVVQIGPVRTRSIHAAEPGKVKVAIRPEAWTLDAPGQAALPGTVAKHAYLGSFQELTVDTALGPIFVMSADVQRHWQVGDSVTLRLPERGVCVVRV